MRKWLFLIILLIILLFSCDKNEFIYKNDPVIPIDVNNNLNINEYPEYSYAIKIIDDNNNIINNLNPLIIENDIVSFNIEIDIDSKNNMNMCLLLLVSGIPIEYSINNVSYSNYNIFDNDKINIKFQPIFDKRYEIVEIIFIEDVYYYTNNSIPCELDYAYSINIPISTNIDYKDIDYLDGNDYVYNMDDFFNEYKDYYFKNEEELNKYIDYILESNNTNLKNNSLHVNIYNTNEGRYYLSKNSIVQEYNHKNNNYLEVIGQAGEYISIIFIDNIPYPAFNGKISAKWTKNSNEILNIPITLPDDIYDFHLIYALIIPINKNIEYYNTVYCSYKMSFYNTKTYDKRNGLLQTIYIENNNEKIYYHEMISENEFDYDDSNINFIFYNEIKNYNYILHYKLLILCDGIIQDFYIENELYSNYSYSLKENEYIMLDISFVPKVRSIKDKYRIDVIFLPEDDNPFNYLTNGNMKYSITFSINNNEGKVNILNEKINILNFENDDVSDDFINNNLIIHSDKYLNNFRRYAFEYIYKETQIIEMKINNIPIGEYVLLGYLNGKLIPISNEGLITHINIIYENMKYTYRFKIEIDDKLSKLIIFLLPINVTDIDSDYYNYYQINSIVLEHLQMIKDNSLGSVNAISYDDNNKNYNYIEYIFNNDNVNAYISSYNIWSLLNYNTFYEYINIGWTDISNSYYTNKKNNIVESFISDNFIIHENIIHIYTYVNNIYKIYKYRTLLYE